jgi:hypothetical protein
MKNGLLSCFVLLSVLTFGQSQEAPTLLIILGRCNHETPATGYSLEVSLIEDPTKCDPVKGFIPLEDQVKHFKESLSVAGIHQESITEKKYYLTTPTRRMDLEIKSSNWTILPAIEQVFRQYQLEPKSAFYTFIPKKFEDEDDWALTALKDAQQKAESIASDLGLHVKRIVNVDDDTRNYSVFNKQPLPPLGENLDNGFDDYDIFDSKSYSPEKTSLYTLRVTFELE